ncbi:hypothetical protein CORC01_05545 [Colletotrichum orchidophilum]|uniref:Myb-like domain-containing protein n=1 Tax=Colletotrichum orchidophilum TaxID=1209926 RepID=A0A1G4BCY8_9PEZI|nr:uncharacterized protein CORC01_05545 [Colletotrichum orchidophilum]OHE99264.1 hypothetical protein CORC01_05545 [Colletotrichum orchidophilum]
MAGLHSWDAEAEKALILSVLSIAYNGAGPKPDWARVTQRMNRIGYDFTTAALTQRWRKSLLKPYNARVNETATAPITPVASRKRAAPGSDIMASGSQTRTSISRGSGPAQAAHEMSTLALSADNGGDDTEPDMEGSKKRIKISHGGAAAGLDDQEIDLTNGDTDVNMEDADAPAAAGLPGQSIDLTDDQVKVVKLEAKPDFPSFSRHARERSLTLNPVIANEIYFDHGKKTAQSLPPSKPRVYEDSV